MAQASDGAPAPVLAAFRRQIGWCTSLGSPFTAAVLTILVEDLAAGGAATRFAAAWPGDPAADALPLRVAGALHALVLAGASPGLAACYPPHAATPSAQAVLGAIAEHAARVQGFVASPPQTNEVGRSAVLLAGFLSIAQATGLPLRLLEIGASAGLNLVWDRYRYRLGGLAWGDPASTLELAPAWEGGPPPDAALRVVERQACDVAPIDLGDPAQRLRLRAYVWADQRERLARLEQAIAIAVAAGVRVAQADAGAWVAARLAERRPGCVTVLYHSIMSQYMPPATQDAIAQAMQAAGAQASADAPLAWLRFEPPQPDARPELTLTLWPGEVRRRLAVAQAHGNAVAWLDEPG